MIEHEQATSGERLAPEAFVYIVECVDGSLYTGWARNVQARVKTHNAGRGARYTRSRRPVRLCYWERHADQATAMRRERQLKTWSRARKLALIDRFQDADLTAVP
jgi:putative endonuclease